MEAEIRQIIGEHTIWGYDDETPEERLGDALRRTKSTLATMESCTGGLLANLITDISGSSDYFLGGYVTYTNQAKIAQGVDPTLIAEHGAISAPVAEAMAVRARRNLNANYGIGITGVAGPNELEGKPPGTIFVGFAWEGGTSSLSFRIRLDRQLVKRRTVTQAMLQMRKLVLEHGAVRA
jgi:nicotinamide-nucleotide amidase